jgi:thymidylate synthase (FAD)
MGKRPTVMDATFSSEMTVELVKHSASDSDIAFAARVSTQGERSKETTTGEIGGLINFLMRERHGSPFEHSTMTFYVKAPIFVWREHMRHRMASYNEESGRYKTLEPHFYVPDKERKLIQVGKTGSYTFEEGTLMQYGSMLAGYLKGAKASYEAYLKMLESGIAKEVARGVLPVNIYSSAYVTMNARALMNFLSLRKSAPDSHFPSYPQREIEMVAEQYEEIFKTLMPLTYNAFVKNGRVAP